MADHKHWTKAELAARNKVPQFRYGWPPRPRGLDRQLRRYWNAAAIAAYNARKLAETDGEILLQYSNAKLTGDLATQKHIAEIFAKRAAFPEPTTPAAAPEVVEDAAPTLARFLASVADERATFAQRLRPDSTLTLDGDVEYAWPDGDAAAVARQYALDVTQGAIVAGELVVRACHRFLSDLETGHERGIYFDPAAARHIAQFSELFCGLVLLPWQTFCLVNIFGFKKPSGARRYVEAWVSTAKKSGKTRLASCVALWGLVADQEKYPDVFSAATKKEIARLVWRDAKRCVTDNQELRDHVQRWAGALAVASTDGSFTPLSSDEKSMDGLRESTIICDEVSFWGISGGGREQWDKLTKGIVSRVQPLIFCVTTAGSTKQCFAFEKFDLAEKILRGIFVDDTTFCFIARIDSGDDPMDETCWIKANVSLGTTLFVEHLRKTRDEVLQQPSGMTAWLQYHCNIWPDVNLGRQGSIPAAKWDACSGLDLIGETDPRKAVQKFLLLNRDTRCYAGLDVGISHDASCCTLLFPQARFVEGGELIDKKCVISQFFLPEVGLIQKAKSWNVPLDVWAREGWCELLPGDLADPREIRKWILQAKDSFNIRQLNFDPWNARVMCAEIADSGSLKCIETPQTLKEMTAPCRELLQWIHRGELAHFGNPFLSWNAANVVMVEDEKNGGTKPQKLTNNELIDGISSLVNAIHGFLNAPPPLRFGVMCLDLTPASQGGK